MHTLYAFKHEKHEIEKLYTFHRNRYILHVSTMQSLHYADYVTVNLYIYWHTR